MDRDIGRLARAVAFALVGASRMSPFALAAEPEEDTCLLVSATCLARGGNSYVYQQVSDRRVRFKADDLLEYDVFLVKSNPVQKGGVDVEFAEGGQGLRDRDVSDQNGLRLHGDGVLGPAVGKWYHRRFALEKVAGLSSSAWNVVFEADAPGVYSQFVDNVVVTHADGTRTVIYADGAPKTARTFRRVGYSMAVMTQPVGRDAVSDEAGVERLIAELTRKQRRLAAAAGLLKGLELAERIVAKRGGASGDALERIRAARRALDGLAGQEGLGEDEFRAGLERVVADLEPLREMMAEYTGHLVGHAHIDSQWLWEWPETLAEFKRTFGQAGRFMEEFPGFTFTQSSSSFYQATEYHHPGLFEEIRKRVREGRWEIVGGTVCETDTNIISAEAHAMHFLYGQRFFRERFEGRQAVVGWAPDTFGHTWQMPQILVNGGCRYYYFCRAGRKIPLFRWEGMDGTRVLCFQEVGSWYNSDLRDRQFDEMMDFERRTGSRDMLWVYGVGNHGGGPTREYVNVALGWMRNPCLPRAKFSTAAAFFEAAERDSDPELIPVVKGDLNTVFEGCYTTHGDVKRWNNDAQALAESAQALAAIAHRYGFPYPGIALRRAWEDICWNHHHDTIDGSSIGAVYRKSDEVYARAMETCRGVSRAALEFLAARVDAPRNAFLVFNPTGAARDGEVECSLPPHGSIRDFGAAAVAGDEASPVQVIDAERRLALFVARSLPPFGYRVYRLGKPKRRAAAELSVSPGGTVLENENLRVTLDARTGAVAGLLDKRSGRELVKPGGAVGRLEVHWERPSGMPAWDIGRIDHVDVLDSPVELKVVERGPVRVAVEFSRRFRENAIRQRVSLLAEGDAVDCRLVVDWKETAIKDGVKARLWPFLRLAADLSVDAPVFTCGIPFGDITRATDGREVPAVGWVDVSNADGGVALMNDCKHGHSMKDGTLRLSLIRTPVHPDPRSDCYEQTVDYALLPHDGSAREAGVAGRALAFLHPALLAETTGEGDATLPRECSFVAAPAGNLLITAVKRAEDDDDLVVRFYESRGTALAAAEGLVRTRWPVVTARRANFLEDEAGDWGELTREGPRGPVRAHEITTLKLGLEPVPGVEMKGTRGPGEERPF